MYWMEGNRSPSLQINQINATAINAVLDNYLETHARTGDAHGHQPDEVMNGVACSTGRNCQHPEAMGRDDLR